MILLFELFFCKKIPLSRRVEYVMDELMDESVSPSVSQIGSTMNSQSNFLL